MSVSDEPRDEYGFRAGSRGRHHRKLVEDGLRVRLDPDVAARFPTSESADAALRSVERKPSDGAKG